MAAIEILSPGVYGFEVAPAKAKEAFSPAKAGFAGWTDEGPSNTPIEVRSPEDFTGIFGGISTKGVVPLSVVAFFATGGERAIVVRVVPADAVAASVQVDASPGPTKWTFTSLGEGAYGNQTTVRIRGNQNFLDRTPGAVAWDKFDVLVIRPSFADPTIPETKETYEAVTLTDPTAGDYLLTVINDPRRPSQYIKTTVGIGGVPSGLLGSHVDDENNGTGNGVLTHFQFALANQNILDGNYRLIAGGTQHNDQAQAPSSGVINGTNAAFVLTLLNSPVLDGSLKLFYAQTPDVIAMVAPVVGAIDGVNTAFTIPAGTLGSAVYRENAVFKIRYAATAGASPQTLAGPFGSPTIYNLATTPLANTPVHPGSVSIAVNTVANGPQVITDDGQGNLTNPLALSAPGTIDYATGAMTGTTLQLNTGSSVVATFSISNSITKAASASNVALGVALAGSLGAGTNTIDLVDSATAPTSNGLIDFVTAVAPLNGSTIYIDFVRTGIINSSLAGVLTGDVNLGPTHTVDFASGLCTFTTSAPPKTGTTIDATYQTGLVVTDNGLGKLIGAVNPAGVNTIDYATGAVDVTFSSAPLNGSPLLSTYDVLAQFLDFPLTGGSDGSAIGRNDISAASLEASKKGIYAFDLFEEPLNVVVPDFEGSQFVQFDLVQFAKNRPDLRFLIMGFANGTKVDEAIKYVQVTQAWDEKIGAIYYPNIYFVNPATARPVLMPITPLVAGVYAKTAHNKNVGKAPGGVEDGALDSDQVVGPEFKVELKDRNKLYQAKINPIIDSNGTGIAVWGVRTLSTERRWRYVNTRTLHDFLMYTTALQLEWAVFENNGPPLWVKITTALRGYYGSLFRLGYFSGDTEDEAFSIKCDSTNNNQKTVSQGKAIIDIGFAPNTPAEFIIFKLAQPVGQQANLV